MSNAAKASEDLPRLCIVIDAAGSLASVIADVPLRVYVIDDGAPFDRVYRLREGLGLVSDSEAVTGALGEHKPGHLFDQTGLGLGVDA